MKVPKHKRFLYRYNNISSIRVGVVTKIDMNNRVEGCFKLEAILNYSSMEDAFAATFKHGSEFVSWVDQNWEGEL